MLQGHVDVVPTGDLAKWADADPFSADIRGAGRGYLHGRGACDMKAGVAANAAVVRTLAEQRSHAGAAARRAHGGQRGGRRARRVRDPGPRAHRRRVRDPRAHQRPDDHRQRRRPHLPDRRGRPGRARLDPAGRVQRPRRVPAGVRRPARAGAGAQPGRGPALRRLHAAVRAQRRDRADRRLGLERPRPALRRGTLRGAARRGRRRGAGGPRASRRRGRGPRPVAARPPAAGRPGTAGSSRPGGCRPTTR